MIFMQFEDSEAARDAIDAALEYLMFTDSYTAQDAANFCASTIENLLQEAAANDA